jgi:hypothetical protein
VRVWDPKTGGQLQSIPAGSVAYAVALRPDGKHVAAGLFDGTVRVYETGSARHVVTLLAAPGGSAEGEWLALTPEAFADGSDGLVKAGRWRASGQPLPAAPVWGAVRKRELLPRAIKGDKLPEPAFAGLLTKP